MIILSTGWPRPFAPSTVLKPASTSTVSPLRTSPTRPCAVSSGTEIARSVFASSPRSGSASRANAVAVDLLPRVDVARGDLAVERGGIGDRAVDQLLLRDGRRVRNRLPAITASPDVPFGMSRSATSTGLGATPPVTFFL